MTGDLKPKVNASTGKISAKQYVKQLLSKMKNIGINTTILPKRTDFESSKERTDFESSKEYIDYLLKMILSKSNAENSNLTAYKKTIRNKYVSQQRQNNQQGYQNNTERMRDLRKQLVELSKKIFKAKEANWKTNTSTLEAEKKALQNELTRLEYPDLYKNGTGGRRTHKKRHRTYTRRRSN